MELNNGEIFTQCRRSTSQLEKLDVWQGSSAVFFIHAPDGLQSVSFIIGTEVIAASFDAQEKCWRVYCQPLYFATAGKFCYTVRAVDECGNQSILGRGTLEVVATPVAGTGGGGGGGEQGIIPANAYAYNPITGKYHKLVATQDPETGVIVVSVNQTGETL